MQTVGKTKHMAKKNTRFPLIERKYSRIKLKFPNIPVQKDYTKDPGDMFLENFPRNELPTSPKTKVNVEVLEFQLLKHKEDLTECEFNRGLKLVNDLRYGASSEQIHEIPGCYVQNSVSTNVYGKEVTDSIATWFTKGFASGPFSEPPFPRFRSNTLIAIKQGEKVRTVVDLSAPEGRSFNDNICIAKLEKVYM
jgi:hypothetical protein